MYGNFPELRETEGKFCGKDLSMEMSLFLYGNSAEMRETEANSAGLIPETLEGVDIEVIGYHRNATSTSQRTKIG